MPEWWTDPDGTFHEKCTLLVFVGTDFLGEAQIDPGSCPKLGYRRGGVAYFCHYCGEIWARLVLLDSAGKQEWFQEVASVSCEKHPDQWSVPGSILEGYRNEWYLEHLPPKALAREFAVHLRQTGE